MRAIHFSFNLYSSIKTVGATVSSGQIDLASDLYQEYIYFMGSETLPSACYILSDESSIPFYSTCNGYNNKHHTFIYTDGSQQNLTN